MMTANDFRAFRSMYFPTQRAMAEALGLDRKTVRSYEDGVTAIPRYIELACAAYAAGITAYHRPVAAA